MQQWAEKQIDPNDHSDHNAFQRGLWKGEVIAFEMAADILGDLFRQATLGHTVMQEAAE
jgi:hypothetical protein